MHAELNPTLSAHERLPTRMQRLREATRLVHARTEALLPLMDPSLATTTYVRVLEAFLGFYAPLEPALVSAAASSGVWSALDERQKVPLIIADLLALGKTRLAIDELPRCAASPRVPSASHAIGVLYVVEGATLGGQIIGRHLRDRLGLDAARGAAFFNGYGARTGAIWKRFSHHVDTSPLIETDAAVSAAVETFETLLSWLDFSLTRP